MHSSIQSIYAMWKCYNMCESVQTIFTRKTSAHNSQNHICAYVRKEHGCIDCTALHAHNDHNGTYENMHSVFYKYKLKQGKSRAPWSLVNEMMPPWLRKVQLPLKKLSLNNNALEKNIPCKLPVVLPRKTFRRWIRWIVLGTVNAQEAILHIRHLLHHNFTQIPEKQHEYEEFVPRSKRKPGLLDGHLLWEMHIALALKKRGWPNRFSTQGLPSSTWTCSVFLWACINCHVPDQFEER